jgi:hypothetical protein
VLRAAPHWPFRAKFEVRTVRFKALRAHVKAIANASFAPRPGASLQLAQKFAVR